MMKNWAETSNSKPTTTNTTSTEQQQQDRPPPPQGQKDEKEQEEESISTSFCKKPDTHDVLYGRGKNVSSHPGNVYFRKLVKAIKVEYVAAPKHQKYYYAELVVQTIKNLNPPGRFLQRKKNTSADADEGELFYDVGDKEAINKARQALREGAPEIEAKLKLTRVIQARTNVRS